MNNILKTIVVLAFGAKAAARCRHVSEDVSARRRC